MPTWLLAFGAGLGIYTAFVVRDWIVGEAKLSDWIRASKAEKPVQFFWMAGLGTAVVVFGWVVFAIAAAERLQ
jgi:hypothetical protein